MANNKGSFWQLYCNLTPFTHELLQRSLSFFLIVHVSGDLLLHQTKQVIRQLLPEKLREASVLCRLACHENLKNATFTALPNNPLYPKEKDPPDRDSKSPPLSIQSSFALEAI